MPLLNEDGGLVKNNGCEEAEDSGDENDTFFDFERDSPLLYYAVAVPKNSKATTGFVLKTLQDAHKKMKEFPGSRLKIFIDPRKADKYASQSVSMLPVLSKVTTQSEDPDRLNIAPTLTITPVKISLPSIPTRSSLQGLVLREGCPFPSVSQPELNILKLAIERGQADRIHEIVWNNPRHLVTDSDVPTIFQNRFHYNALHLATFHRQAASVRALLTKLGDPDFWRSLYPFADEASQAYRRRRLLDYYLNAAESGNCETPLHFACKFGSEECVSELVRLSELDYQVRNSMGQTPAQCILQRWNGPVEDKESLTRRIILLLNQRYVLLLSSTPEKVYSPPTIVSEPVTLPDLLQRLQRMKMIFEDSGVALLAYAGPFMPDQAQLFAEQWRHPRRLPPSIRQECLHARRVDCEKGMQMTGRLLAQHFCTEWREMWEFLGEFVDLGSLVGWQRLEAHLQHILDTRRLLEESSSCLPPESLPSNGNSSSESKETHLLPSSPCKVSSSTQLNHSSSSSFSMGQLTNLFSRLRLWNSSNSKELTAVSLSPSLSAECPPSDKRPGLSLSLGCLQENQSHPDKPCKLDLQVYRALEPFMEKVSHEVAQSEIELSVDPLVRNFPLVCGWKRDIDAFLQVSRT